jgi:hypothetical protein
MGRQTHPNESLAICRPGIWPARDRNGAGLRTRCPRKRACVATTLLVLGMALHPGSPICAAGGPILWGYGVKGCQEFLRVAPGAGGAAAGETELLRYREWLAGLVSGLNLATGLDVLQGAELDAALARIRTHCEAHPEDDFFNASLVLLKSLGTTEDKVKK